MRKMTEEFLKNAFSGQSQAHMRYVIFADEAEKAGLINIARLFRAISYAERVHATNHYRALGMIRETPKNLEVAIAGETYEVEEMYPAYKAVAELQGENDAIKSFFYALEAEKIHAKMYSDSKKSSEAGKDIDIGQVYICSVCGYTGFGEPPDVCPVCKNGKEKFRLF